MQIRELDPAARQAIEEFARQQAHGGMAGHDYGHVHRVRVWAKRIAAAEGFVRLDCVEAAALLHDVARSRKDVPSRRHGEVGAEIAAQFLTKWPLGGARPFDETDIADIAHAISFHNHNRRGSGRLLDILRDADMMEMFGPIGIIRGVTPYPNVPEFDPTNPRGDTAGHGAAEFDRRFDAGLGMGSTLVDHLNFHLSCLDNLATEAAQTFVTPYAEFLREFIEALVRQAEETRE